ncbi:unnamed protein product, partial [Staurois parvus]
MEVSGGITREGWRTLNGGQWSDCQREGWKTLMEASGRIGRGVEDTEWRPVEGLPERGWRALSGGQWRDWQRGVADTERGHGLGG